MQPGQVDNDVVIRDRAGERTVVFDTTSSGSIVSYKYVGVEHIRGWNGGGLLRIAFHNSMKRGPWPGGYNPTRVGDGSGCSQVAGVACKGTETIAILTMMLNFNHNNGFYEKPLIAVWGGRLNDVFPLSYGSPYTIEASAP